MKKISWQLVASDWLLTVGLVFSLFCALSPTLAQPPDPLSVLCLLMGSTLFWVLILRVPAAGISFFVLTAAAAAILLLTGPAKGLTHFDVLWENASPFVQWVLDTLSYPTAGIEAPAAYVNRALLLASAGSSLIMGTLVCCRTHPAVLLVLGGGAFTLLERSDWDFSTPAFVLFLLFLALYIALFAYRGQARRTGQPPKALSHLAAALPLCALGLTAALLSPAADMDWGGRFLLWADGLLPQWALFDGVDSRFSEMNIFTYSGLEDGQWNGGVLGGPAQRSSNLVLYIAADAPPSYLKGHTYTTYTGQRWESLDAQDNIPLPRLFSSEYDWPFLPYTLEPYPALLASVSRESFSGYGRFLHGVLEGGGVRFLYGAAALFERFEFSGGEPSFEDRMRALSPLLDASSASPSFLRLNPDTVRRRSQTIIYWDMRTRTLFLPSDAISLPVFEASRDTLRLTPSGDVTMTATQGREFRYTVDSVALNLTEAQRTALLRLSYPGLLEDLNEASYTGRPARTDPDGLFLMAMRAERAEARAYYLSLPAELPARVRTLAEELTKTQETDYDKARALETYLRETFPYDLNTPPTPPSQDFVDYFLFDLQRGYCTYYASALAVMARSIGLPARYVEGFAPSSDKIEEYYYATGKQAHAWVEIFFEGFGWIPFEPTASFSGSWNGAPPEGAGITPTPSPDLPSPSPLPSAAPNPTPTGGGPDSDPSSGGGVSPWWWLIPSGALLLAIWPLLYVLRRRALFRQARQGPDRRVSLRLFERIVALARLTGIDPPAFDETVLAWGQRADLTARHGEPVFAAAAQIAGRLRFGPDGPTAADQAALLALLLRLDAQAAARRPWRRLLRLVTGVGKQIELSKGSFWK
ncbi:MAG: transglutaminase-like domain-containing protein [Oscillospiraceae bacterium]|jgi:transglutaminase-like putative cysteine protease|nr:transglutaminase-like domain-containing protein [Oscillospiraceae bacterium]